MLSMSLDRKPWATRLAFFLGCPILLSLPLGLFQAGFAQHLSLQVSVFFWAFAWVSTWLMSEAFLRLIHPVLRPWNIALIPEIVLANMLTIIAYSFYFPPIMFLFAEHATSLPPDYFDNRTDRGSLEHVLMMARSGLAGLIAWVLLRSLYAMLPGEAARTPDQPHSSGDGTARQSHPTSKFRRELSAKGIANLDRIIALQASDHYVNVYLDDGRKEFILSRFSDAISDLSAQDGLRIHRSYWVNRRAIDRIERDGPALTIHLTNDLACPVSIKYQGYFEHFLAQA